jgi:xanthine dehydrogenase accessory factor
MIVSSEAVHGTIGGGRLEWEVLASARALLGEGTSQVRVCKFVLGPELGQCCGGAVEVWLELHTRSDLEWLEQAWQRSRCEPLELCSTWSETRAVHRSVTRAARPRRQTKPAASLQRSGDGAVTLVQSLDRAPTLYLYGAGHVGRAVLRIAAELPWQVTCIDSRSEFLAAARCGEVEMMYAPEPAATVAQAPAGSCFLVMTHSHALDYALVRAILERGTTSQDGASQETSWVGLIGSHSKSARFRAQLRRDGIAATQVERLVCPIGLGVRDKQPMAIAVSVVAQLLQHFHATLAEAHAAAVHAEDCAQSCSQCAVNVVPS